MLYICCHCGLGLRWVYLDEVLQFSGISGDRAAAFGFHIRVDAAVTEDKAWGGQHGGVCAEPPAQRTVPAVRAQPRFFAVLGRDELRIPTVALLPQVERGWRSRQGGEGFHSALVVRGVPPLQELQEEDAQGERGGEGNSNAPRCLWDQPPHSLHQAANRGTIVGSGFNTDAWHRVQENIYI